MEYIDEYVKCPFYLSSGKGKDGKHRIKCEGAFEGADCIQHQFVSAEAGKEHIWDYCCGNYHGCVVNHMLNEKYHE